MTAPKPFRIGFSRSTAIGIPFWTIAEHGARSCARELGLTLSVQHSVTPEEQAAAIHRYIEQHVDAIIVAAIDPHATGFVAALDSAGAASIPVIAVDVAVPRPIASLIRSDDLRGAASGAAYLAEKIGGQGKVVHLQGFLHSPVAQLRSAGVRQELDRFPLLEIVLETDAGGWDRARSKSIMQELLTTHPDIRGVIAANDPMALGAMDAIEEAGRAGQVIAVGIDGDPHALLAVQAGFLAATVGRSPYLLGRVAVETAFALGRGAKVPSEILLDDMTLVNPDTITGALINALQIMPGVIDDLMETSVAMAAERTMLRTIIDSLPDSIYVKDREGRFIVANKALARLSGVADPDALTGKTDHDLFPTHLANQYWADDQQVLQSGVPVIDKEELVLNVEGEQHWLTTTKIPLRDDRGEIQRLVGRGKDITERKQAEEERQRLQQELIETQAITLQELSTPLIPVSDTVLVMPLIGRIDSRRASQILETLLTGVQQQQADVAIVDITGLNVVDTHVAQTLLQAARAVKLLGAQIILTGIRPEVAQTLVSLGVNLDDIVTHSSLQRGIAYGLQKY